MILQRQGKPRRIPASFLDVCVYSCPKTGMDGTV
jgi:hypothetical protein